MLNRLKGWLPCTSLASWVVLLASILPLYAWAQDVTQVVPVEGLGSLGSLGLTGLAAVVVAKVLGLLDRWTSLFDRAVKLAEDVWGEAKKGNVKVGIDGGGDR